LISTTTLFDAAVDARRLDLGLSHGEFDGGRHERVVVKIIRE
jgi:hypothetical protein